MSSEQTRYHLMIIGAFTVDPSRNTIIQDEASWTLEPKIMDVLCVLAEASGAVISRASLVDHIWRVQHGGDESLTRAISVLRKTFRDAGDNGVYIETIPRRGYRLAKPVTLIDEPPLKPPTALASRENVDGSDIARPTAPRRLFARQGVMIAVGLLLVAGLSISILIPGLTNSGRLASAETENVTDQTPTDEAAAIENSLDSWPEAAKAIESGNFQTVLRLLKSTQPTGTAVDVQNWRYLGALAYDKKPAVSLQAYRRTVELGDNDFETWQRLTLLEQDHGSDIAAALAAAENAERVADTFGRRLDALGWIAQLEWISGKNESALMRHRQIVTLARDKLKENPSEENIWLTHLTAALDDLGIVEMEAGNLKAARAAIEEQVSLDRKRLDEDPDNLVLQRDLSVSLENLGALEVKEGNLSAAESVFHASLELGRHLEALQPKNMEAKRDLSNALFHIGEVAMARKRYPEAFVAHEESLFLTRVLIAQNPNNTLFRRDLLEGLTQMAAVNVSLGDRDTAITNLEEGVAIGRVLASDNPDDVQVIVELAKTLAQLGETSQEETYLLEAQSLIEPLIDQRKLSSEGKAFADLLREKAQAAQ